jgi:transcriptional regulator of acetoin/glycerol metabolism
MAASAATKDSNRLETPSLTISLPALRERSTTLSLMPHLRTRAARERAGIVGEI